MEHTFLKPAEIERESMRIIEEELSLRGIFLPEKTSAVVKRVIHTTADFDYAVSLAFTDGAVEKAIHLFGGGRRSADTEAGQSGCPTAKASAAGASKDDLTEAGKDVVTEEKAADRSKKKDRRFTVITDTNMARAGISAAAVKKLGGEVRCFMAEPEIARAAKEEGTTRAAVSMEYALRHFPQAVLAVGNAPTALLRIADLVEAGARPSLVIAVPVGFVNVTEGKERLMEVCRRYEIPAIAAMGRKGGSNVAAAIMNALLYSAAGMLDPGKR